MGRIEKHFFRNEVNVSGWGFDRRKEALEQVAKDEARKLSIVQEIMIRSTDYWRRIIAPAEGKEALRCHICARIVTVSRWKTTFGGSLGEKGVTIGGARFLEKSTTGSNQHRLLVVQTGESVNQAKVFEAHGVPQGFCGNLIYALKLLANQQEDVDGLIQNIATNLGEASRKGLMNGLRDFIKIDGQRPSGGMPERGHGTLSTKAERIIRLPRGEGRGEPR